MSHCFKDSKFTRGCGSETFHRGAKKKDLETDRSGKTDKCNWCNHKNMSNMKFCYANCKKNEQYPQPIGEGGKGGKQIYQHVCTQKCTRDGCPAWHVRNPQTNRCIHRKKQTYQDVCTQKCSRDGCSAWNVRSPRKKQAYSKKGTQKCTRDGCPAWHVRSPRTNRCIHRKKQAYQDVCTKSPKSPKRYTHKPYTCHCIQPVHKKIEFSSTVELLNSIEDITSINEVQEYVDSSDPGQPSTYLDDEWWPIPKVLRSGARTFVPTKILGKGAFGVVFNYKEEGKENQPDLEQNTIALKLVNGKSVADSDCKGTMDYFPTVKNVSQICKGVIYQRCISPQGFLVHPIE